MKRREAKCDRKIQGLISKMKVSASQMSFYQNIAESKDLKGNLSGLILTQNKLLKLLQEPSESRKFGMEIYTTKPGLGQQPSTTSVEAHDPKFFADNKEWLMGEVDKYLESATAQPNDPLEEKGDYSSEKV